MLTGLIFLTVMFAVLTIGAAASDYTKAGDLIDKLTQNLPMNWVWSEHEDEAINR